MDKDKIVFSVNGQKVEITNKVDPRISLSDYIRRHLNLTATKTMCRQGSCGACIVNMKEIDPVTNKEKTYAINSCLVSPFSCHGKEITTNEGLGNKVKGYHEIQKRLANFNGSQCGFCSSGWVLNMYSLLANSGNNLTKAEIENSFGGNICRCTGYRPIADAMKSFASDNIRDIEDVDKLNICYNSGEICTKTCTDHDEEHDFCIIHKDKQFNAKDIIEIDFKNNKWIKVFTLDQLFSALANRGKLTYMLVAGNTAKGVYPIATLPNILIDISDIPELKRYSLGTNLEIGAGTTLTELRDIFRKVSKQNEYFMYLKELLTHLDLVSNIPKKNIGTIAGNLVVKREHAEFPSDIFLILETIGAVIRIGDGTKKSAMAPREFLKTKMNGNVILNVDLPPLSRSHILKTYKIMPRAQNALALVNAGFLIKLQGDSSSIIQNATIVYGNINNDFIHAANTEKYLSGKNLYDNAVLISAIDSLVKELKVQIYPGRTSPAYRKLLASALFYKFILRTVPRRLINATYRSGGTMLERAISSGRQVYDINQADFPVHQPVIKLESQVQCSGEAIYVNDIPMNPGELQAAFILSTVPKATLVGIDVTEALKLDGVVAIYTAKDIPGNNYFLPPGIPEFLTTEEIFVEIGNTVKYNGQPIGIVVGVDDFVVQKATLLVKTSYANIVVPPILTIDQALAAPDAEARVVNERTEKATTRGDSVTKVFSGKFKIGTQYHFYMETHSCVCVPLEDGMDVFIASQWLDQVNASVAGMLNILESSVNVTIRRVGGSFGGKHSRASLTACACALAAFKSNRPVRLILPLETNMRVFGKRHSARTDYEIGINRSGQIQYMNADIYEDNGFSRNDTVVNIFTLPAFLNCYNTTSWTVSANGVFTDKASTIFTRAPGTCDGIAMIENIMQRIAFETGEDIINVRLANIAQDNSIRVVIQYILEVSEYYTRLSNINEYNRNNRWKKKGISLSIMQFPYAHLGNFTANVSIYHTDGSVAVTISGIEMGQGLNTKIAQVVAHALSVPLKTVKIKPSNSIATPNGHVTDINQGSDIGGYAALKACEILNTRLDAIRSSLTNPTWLELIAAAFTAGVNLNASYMYAAQVDNLEAYPIHGASISEVDVDMLTGNHVLTRVDLVEDTGQSLSPLIDVGQIEGAFVMGMGYWTTEEIIHDQSTGAVLTDSSLTYHVPGLKDIPADFRIYFRPNAPNPIGILGSKVTGEPPLTLAFSVAQAIRHALNSARADAGLNTRVWYELEYPLTAEHILLASGTDPKDFKLK